MQYGRQDIESLPDRMKTDVRGWVDQVAERLQDLDLNMDELAKLSTKITHRLQVIDDESKATKAVCDKLAEQKARESSNLAPTPFLAKVSQIYRDRSAATATATSDHRVLRKAEVNPRFAELKKEHDELKTRLNVKLDVRD